MMSSLQNISVIRTPIPLRWGFYDVETGTKYSATDLPDLKGPQGVWPRTRWNPEGDSKVYVAHPHFRCHVDRLGQMHVATPGVGEGHQAAFSVVGLPLDARADLSRFLLSRFMESPPKPRQ
jgi:hypothetical protein